MIVILEKPATDKDIKRAAEDYETYIKITIDIKKEIVAIGGEYHADAEIKLLNLGSRQEDIWGGGLSLKSKILETNALINLRIGVNGAMEIVNSKIRDKFLSIAEKYLGDHTFSAKNNNKR